MQADDVETFAAAPVTAETAEPFPGLRPVLVAEEEDVDELVRTARAGIAVLSLHLRTARHEASVAASERGDWDVEAARAFLVATIEERMKARRVEMAKELEQARTEAAHLVLSTRTEAAALIAKAGEDTLDVLLAGTEPGSAAARPSLQVITDLPLRDPGVAPQPLPTAFPDPDAFAAPVPRAAAPAPPVVEPRVVDTAPAPPVTEPRPVALPQPAPLADPVPAVPQPQPAAEREPVVLPQMVPVAPASAPPSDVSPLAATAVVSAIVAAAPAAAAAATAQPETSRLKQFLYLDVLLPMVAVLVVLVVLLAWIG